MVLVPKYCPLHKDAGVRRVSVGLTVNLLSTVYFYTRIYLHLLHKRNALLIF